MRLPRGIRRLPRLERLFGRDGREVDEELRHHFDEAVRAHVRGGMSEDEALQRALERFGDVRAYRRALRKIDDGRRRVMARGEMTDGLRRTLTRAVRGLWRSPGLTVSVVTILGLGIGANAVMFGVVDRLLLSPPRHVVDADDVGLLHVRRVGFNGDVFTSPSITWPDYLDFAGVEAFAAVAAVTDAYPTTVGRGPGAEQAEVAGASGSLFGLLGVQPYRGRFFGPEDDRPGAPGTAVISHEYWQRNFGGDESALGGALDVGTLSYTIVGVAPAGFTGPGLRRVDVWLPITVYQTARNGDGWDTNRNWYWMRAVARLLPTATMEAATAEATAAHRGGRAELIAEGRYDERAEVIVAPVIAARGPQPDAEARVAAWLVGVALIVLLIACFNVANLLLARAIHARHEMAVRLTLGAGRRRLVADLFAESLLLAGLGALAAVALARMLGGTVHRTLLPGVAFADVGSGARIAVFTIAACLAAALVSGLVPALYATKAELADALRSASRGVAAGRSRTRSALLVGQAALSVVLLVGAGLFVRSLDRAEDLDLGFDADRVLVVSLEWNETLPSQERSTLYEEAMESVRRLPGVRAVGLTYTVPFQSTISLGQPRVPGLDSIPRHHSGGPYVNKVGAGYFESMGLTILQGRAFAASDAAPGAPPVGIVSESMARAVWPAGDALGACMMIGDDAEAPCTEIVGIVENHRRQNLVEDDPHFLYYLNRAHPEFAGPPQAMMVQAGGDPRVLLEAVRAEVRELSTRVRFVNALPMSDLVEPEMRSWRLGATMFSAFGLLALIVAGWGLYSVLAFDVALRRHELGVRAALGAGMPRILRMVLRRALALVVLGGGIGLLAAYLASGAVQPLLFRTSATDWGTYAMVLAALVAVGALAGALPAWRATRVDPRTALQSD